MRYVPALLLDAVFVLVFAAIGRASHDENPAGFLITAWPFLVALVVGHLIAALLPGRPRRPWALAWGAVVWVVTVAGGMLLRIASGDTAQVAFIVVATITLGVLLIGWRAAAALMRRRRVGRAAVSADPAAEPDPVAEGERGTDSDREVDDERATEAEHERGSASEPEQR
jgi:drug/metabolite transporter (DMT)-like permease